MKGLDNMIDYLTIIEAKNGNEEATFKILDYYMKKIHKFSTDEDFMQIALYEIFVGIKNF